jgi:PTH2 family peptidyl-tRNA hydrolase
MSSPKQVIVMRTDLNMRKGKMAAQASHASMAVILDMMESEYTELYERRKLTIPEGSALSAWLNGPFKKICVGIDSEAGLLELYEKVKAAGIPTALITDSGLTEFNGVKTHTCIAIGPDLPEKIDPFTSHLKLL